jgi:hypothetical protein
MEHWWFQTRIIVDLNLEGGGLCPHFASQRQEKRESDGLSFDMGRAALIRE